MMYVANKRSHEYVTIIPCTKIAGKRQEFILWNDNRDQSFEELQQETSLIIGDGSFIPSHSSYDEIGYFYISKDYVAESVELITAADMKMPKNLQNR